MEKLLEEILKELKYQTQLFETIYKQKDETVHMKKEFQGTINMLKKQFENHPAFKQFGGIP